MKKLFAAFVGIDVSKLKLDVCLLFADENSGSHQVFDNTVKGIKMMLEWILKFKSIPKENYLFCLEYTGIYTMPLCCYLSGQQYQYAIVPAVEILQSIGVKRGKSDKTDAKAIANYARMRSNEIRLYQLPEKNLMKLKLLLSHRNRLVKTRKAFYVAMTEPASYIDKKIIIEINRHNKQLVVTLDKKIKQVESHIAGLIVSDEQMKKTYALLISIPGIGPHIAASLIVYTRCFTVFENSRKFACYAGIAPFEHKSGISLRGRSRVSHMANKRMKSLLNLAALTARKTDGQISLYYDRKLKEGKNPMLILNNIRNKLVARIFATIKRQTPYVFTMQFVA
jgi:transposase